MKKIYYGIRESIYVASSYRNVKYDGFVRQLRRYPEYFTVYDFKEDDADVKGVDLHGYTEDRDHFFSLFERDDVACLFARDLRHLRECDILILFLPCGKSAHLELGYACGLGKKCYIVLNDVYEPEFTYLLAGKDHIFPTPIECIHHLLNHMHDKMRMADIDGIDITSPVTSTMIGPLGIKRR